MDTLLTWDVVQVLLHTCRFILLTALGFVALEMAKRFKAVTGLDPASKMVELGLQPSSSSETPRINYRVGAAEDMASAGVADESVDLVTAGW